MKLTPIGIAGAFAIAIEPRCDERGYFARLYCCETLRRAGATFGTIRQTSISFNAERCTLRGLHFQAEPAPEGKIVRVSRGRIFDCFVDLRRDSPTHRHWFGTELSAEAQNALLIPPGCAHGFLTLEDNCAVEYMMDADYVPELARGCRWNDPAFGIVWPEMPRAMSERDRTWPDYAP
ncbi:MAG TPA: dTDP-4-dehydrorhamnose 3,5-epimerase family protein [Micropepsaceae bacterium]